MWHSIRLNGSGWGNIIILDGVEAKFCFVYMSSQLLALSSASWGEFVCTSWILFSEHFYFSANIWLRPVILWILVIFLVSIRFASTEISGVSGMIFQLLRYITQMGNCRSCFLGILSNQRRPASAWRELGRAVLACRGIGFHPKSFTHRWNYGAKGWVLSDNTLENEYPRNTI
jgi:hypothetical protein